MKISRVAGTTNEILQIFVRDSSSTTGAGLTGLVFNTASLVAYYIRNNQSTATSISLVTMTLGTYTSGGFKEIDATNMPGWYQFCPPSGVFTSGGSAAIHLKGATNMAPLPIEVEITAWNNQDATAGGISRIDAAISSRMATYTQPTGFLAATFPSGTIANTTNITAGTITTTTNLTTNNDKTGYSLSGTQTFNVTGNITGNLSGSVGSVTGAVGSVTAGVTVTTNNDKTGYALTSGERTSVADVLLDRDMSTGTDSGSPTVRTVRQALRASRNKVSISGSTMTVTKEDDSTASWTAALTTDAAALPITAFDPA